MEPGDLEVLFSFKINFLLIIKFIVSENSTTLRIFPGKSHFVLVLSSGFHLLKHVLGLCSSKLMLIVYSIVHFSLLLLPLLKKYWPRYPSSWQNFSEPGTSCHSNDQHRTVNLIYKQKWNQASRAVKKILSSRLVINSRRLWNSLQRYKFLRTEASWDILKLVSEMPFPGVFKWYFRCRHLVVSSQYTQG